MRHAIAALALTVSLFAGAVLAGCTGSIDEGPTNSTSGVAYGASRFPRLTHPQWENATRDLLRLDDVPGDSAMWAPENTTGIFDNVGAELDVTGSLWENYRDGAEGVAVAVAGDPARLARVLPSGLPTEPAARARGFIEAFGLRAYRRRLTDAEVSTYTATFNAAAANYPSLGAFEAGVAQTIATMLQSPHFLYRVERSSEPTGELGDRIALDGYEVATRLSFALWNTIPDDALLAAAESGELGTEAGVRGEAARMLEDDRAAEVLVRFHHLLLGTAGYSQINRSGMEFPEWNEMREAEQRASLVSEVDAFVRDVVIERDLGLGELLTADYTFADGWVAGLYGNTAVTGDTFQRIDLPAVRSGILTMPGFLAANATSLETDPIHRGVFVARRIACADLPAPPNGVPVLPPDPSRMRSMRDRVESHTGQGACASCHSVIINPLGYAFERFDALGRVQNTERRTGAAIDTADDYVLDGVSVHYEDAVELTEALAASRQVHNCYAGHLAEYMFADRPIRRSLARHGGEASIDGSTRDVVLALVSNELFRTRPTAEYDGPAPTPEE